MVPPSTSKPAAFHAFSFILFFSIFDSFYTCFYFPKPGHYIYCFEEIYRFDVGLVRLVGLGVGFGEEQPLHGYFGLERFMGAYI